MKKSLLFSGRVAADVAAAIERQNKALEKIRPALAGIAVQNKLLAEKIKPIVPPVTANVIKNIAALNASIVVSSAVAKGIADAAVVAEQLRKSFSAFEGLADKIAWSAKIPSIDIWRDIFEKLPDQTREHITVLGEHGWYIDNQFSVPFLHEVVAALKAGNTQEAEEALQEHYRARLTQIEKDLIEAFPARETIFKSIFKAHASAEYALTIPVLLAQADGVCQELMGEQLYKKENKQPATKPKVEETTDSDHRAAFLHAFTIPLPISASQKERGTNFTGLNRHAVLHGESTNYNSEINSLKAISLVLYVYQCLVNQ